MRRYVIPRIACTNLASEFQLLAGSPGDGDNEDFKPGFFTHHFIKDMKLALEECEKMNIKLPGLETAYKIYNELEEEVRNTNGTQAISKWYKL